MFDLEQSIAEWRRGMLAAGIKSPVPLDELESHLRDDIEQQMRSGINAEPAFAAAIQRIGQPGVLKTEFKQARQQKCNARSSWRGLWFGGFGLVLTAMLNVAGLFIFHRSSSIVFSDKWWSAWFPDYAVWMTFTIVGVALALANWRSRHRINRRG